MNVVKGHHDYGTVVSLYTLADDKAAQTIGLDPRGVGFRPS